MAPTTPPTSQLLPHNDPRVATWHNGIGAALVAHGVTILELTYEGYGDSGNGYDVTAYGKAGQGVALGRELVDEVKEWLGTFIDDGYEQAEGGGGAIRVAVERCMLIHESYYNNDERVRIQQPHLLTLKYPEWLQNDLEIAAGCLATPVVVHIHDDIEDALVEFREAHNEAAAESPTAAEDLAVILASLSIGAPNVRGAQHWMPICRLLAYALAIGHIRLDEADPEETYITVDQTETILLGRWETCTEPNPTTTIRLGPLGGLHQHRAHRL
jgi:hypothetical protein